MKITDIQAITLNLTALERWQDFALHLPLVHPMSKYPEHTKRFGWQRGSLYDTIVLISTDAGITGFGRGGDPPAFLPAIIEEHLSALVIGSDPFDRERLWDQMFRASISFGRKGAVLDAISAIDIALWDIIGKATNQPVYKLLGGKTKDKIRVYASNLHAIELDALSQEAADYVQRGFTAMKLRFGWGPKDGRPGMRRNIELVKTVRETVGDDIEIMGECAMGWGDIEYAIEMSRRLEPYYLKWIEEPLLADDLVGYIKLTSASPIPIAAGETEFTKWGFRELLERHAVDIVQPDIYRVGGITEAQKVSALAQAYNAPVMPHGVGVPQLHFIMANDNCPLAEYVPLTRMQLDASGLTEDDRSGWGYLKGEPIAQGGFIELSDAPGFGVELDEEVIERIRVKKRG